MMFKISSVVANTYTRRKDINTLRAMYVFVKHFITVFFEAVTMYYCIVDYFSRRLPSPCISIGVYIVFQNTYSSVFHIKSVNAYMATISVRALHVAIIVVGSFGYRVLFLCIYNSSRLQRIILVLTAMFTRYNRFFPLF